MFKNRTDDLRVEEMSDVILTPRIPVLTHHLSSARNITISRPMYNTEELELVYILGKTCYLRVKHFKPIIRK